MEDEISNGRIIRIILRLVATVYCIYRADVLKRSKIFWGLLGFVFPVIALIVIHFMNPVISWEEQSNENTDDSPPEEQKDKEI